MKYLRKYLNFTVAFILWSTVNFVACLFLFAVVLNGPEIVQHTIVYLGAGLEVFVVFPFSVYHGIEEMFL